MSRCFKHYDVKQLLRQSGCVPATREIMEIVNPLFNAMLTSFRFS